MKPVRYTARDGLAISAYLTVPRGAVAKNLPVIVIVHDGPSERVRWGWDPVVQFLASRGFAVFQPNYRGSTGYGREHERMGYGQWGLAMQDDLADGVRWLVARGHREPDARRDLRRRLRRLCGAARGGEVTRAVPRRGELRRA